MHRLYTSTKPRRHIVENDLHNYMMLEENPLVHTVAVQSTERVLSGLQSLAYWELRVPYMMNRLFLGCRSWCDVDGVPVCGLY